jgi:hypothetical protein
MSNKGNGYRKAALNYLSRGWAALAIRPRDKRPLGAWKHWQGRLPTIEELTAQWAAVPNANVGIVCGAVSGLVGVDVDGVEGEQLLAKVSGGDPPATLSFRTGRGLRLLYALPATMHPSNWCVRGGAGEVKVLGNGTVSVMPPSMHATGKKYRWMPRHGPGHVEPATAPGWVIAGVSTVSTVSTPTTARSTTEPPSDGGTIPAGQRNGRLFRIACAIRRHGCTRDEILHTLERVNRRCVPPLTDEELRWLAGSAGRYPAAW